MIISEDPQGGCSILGLQDAIPQGRELPHRHRADARAILDDEDRRVAGSLDCRLGRLLRSLDGFAAHAREIQLYGSAVADLAVDIQVTAGLPGDAVDYAQSEPHAPEIGGAPGRE